MQLKPIPKNAINKSLQTEKQFIYIFKIIHLPIVKKRIGFSDLFDREKEGTVNGKMQKRAVKMC